MGMLATERTFSSQGRSLRAGSYIPVIDAVER
jgi:hypothetical protein